MLPNQPNTQHKSNGLFFGLVSRKHRILFQQIFSGSSVQKKLLIFMLFAAAGFSLTLGLLIYFGLNYSNSRTTCTKPECIIAANRLLEGMNTLVDPCENFYEYVCGNWAQSHSLIEEVNSWFIERTKFVNQEIKDILEEEYSALDPKPVSQMKEYYEMCMDTSNLNTKGFQPLYEVLDLLELPRVLPHVGISKDFNLAKVLASAQRLLNLDIIIQLSTHFNSTLNTTLISISPVSPKFSYMNPESKVFKRKVVTSDEFLVHQIRYMTAVISELTPGVNANDISREAIKMLLLDAQLKVNAEEEGVLSIDYFSFNDLESYMFFNNQNLNSPFSWQDYISTITSGLNVSLQMNDTVAVVNSRYFQALGANLINLKLINFERYIWWKIIDTLATHTTDQIRSYKFIFYEHVYKGIMKHSRSADCISLVKNSFPEAIIHVFTKRNNISNAVIKIGSMMTRIKKSLKKMIQSSSWMDLHTKEINLMKADNVKVHIGYPEECFNLSWLIENFENVDIIPDDFMSSLMNIHSAKISKIINFVNGPNGYLLENTSWLFDPNEVNAYYIRDLNSIVIPSGILQYPFFTDGGESLNYGAVGSILGHELVHGFDNEGMGFDWNGKKTNMWTDNMTNAFNQQTQCFINQYQKYYISDNMTIDGNITLAENIADTEGLRSAFYAYEDYVAENGAELALPAFENFSHQQLLFMSFANIYCIKENEFHRNIMKTDEHSPQNSRVIGTLSNMAEFATAWNCKSNVPMNPSNKCSLW